MAVPRALIALLAGACLSSAVAAPSSSSREQVRDLARRMKGDIGPRDWLPANAASEDEDDAAPGLRGGACSGSCSQASRVLADGSSALNAENADPRECCCGYQSTPAGNCTLLQAMERLGSIDYTFFSMPQTVVPRGDSRQSRNVFTAAAGFGAGLEKFYYFDVPAGVPGLVLETCGTPCARYDNKQQCLEYSNSYGPQVMYVFNSCPRGYAGQNATSLIPASAVVTVSANASEVYPGGCVTWNQRYSGSPAITGGNLNQSILYMPNPKPGRYWLGVDGGLPGAGGYFAVWATVVTSLSAPGVVQPAVMPPALPLPPAQPALREQLVPAMPTPAACCANCSSNMRALVGNEGFLTDSTTDLPSKLTATREIYGRVPTIISYYGGERVYALNITDGGAATLNIDTCSTPLSGAGTIIYVTLACPWLVSGNAIESAVGRVYPTFLGQYERCPGNGAMVNITNLPPGLYYILVDTTLPGGDFVLSWSMTLYPGNALPSSVIPWMNGASGTMPDCPLAVPPYPTVSVTPTPTSTPTASVTPSITPSASASMTASPSFTPSITPSASPACQYNPAPGTFNMVSTAVLVANNALPSLRVWRQALAPIENGTTPACHIRRLAARLVGVEPTSVILRVANDAYFNETWTPGLPVDFGLNDCNCIGSLYVSTCTTTGPPPPTAWDSGSHVIQRATPYSPAGTLLQINVILPAAMPVADAAKRLLMLNADALATVCQAVPQQMVRIFQAIFYYSLPIDKVGGYLTIASAAETVVVSGLDPGRAPSASPEPIKPDDTPSTPIGLIIGIIIGVILLLLLLCLLARYIRRKKQEAAKQRNNRRSMRGGALGAASAPAMELAAPVPAASSLSNERATRVTQMAPAPVSLPGVIATANPASGSARGRTMMAPAPRTAIVLDDGLSSSARHISGDADRERAAFTPQMRRGSSAGRRPSS